MFKTLKSFWLPCLSGSESESSCGGHQLEEPGVMQLLNENQFSGLSHVVNLGLVKKKQKNYAKTIIDFVGVSNNEFVGIKMKACLSNASYRKQLDILMKLHCNNGSTSDQQYFTVDAESEEICTYIESTHELIQILLHHAYVLNFSKVMLVTLSNDGK
eukprot:15345803-Ditylum_brightwellii.AAC.1